MQTVFDHFKFLMWMKFPDDSANLGYKKQKVPLWVKKSLNRKQIETLT